MVKRAAGNIHSAAQGAHLVTDVRVLLIHADHDAREFRLSHDTAEDTTGRILSREAGLAHAAPIVHHLTENKGCREWGRRGVRGAGLPST